MFSSQERRAITGGGGVLAHAAVVICGHGLRSSAYQMKRLSTLNLHTVLGSIVATFTANHTQSELKKVEDWEGPWTIGFL